MKRFGRIKHEFLRNSKFNTSCNLHKWHYLRWITKLLNWRNRLLSGVKVSIPTVSMYIVLPSTWVLVENKKQNHDAPNEDLKIYTVPDFVAQHQVSNFSNSVLPSVIISSQLLFNETLKVFKRIKNQISVHSDDPKCFGHFSSANLAWHNVDVLHRQ